MKQYSAADIQRYLKGEMSAEEMHAIETAALDDPFLADAIEGFEMAMAHSEESTTGGLHRLHAEFSERTRPVAKVVVMPPSRWWWISAAAVIFLIIGVTVYNNWMITGSENSALAVTEQKKAGVPRPDTVQDQPSASLMSTDSTIVPNNSPSAPTPAATDKREQAAPKKDLQAEKPSSNPEAAITSSPKTIKDDVANANDEYLEKAKKEQPPAASAAEGKSVQKEGGVADAGAAGIDRRSQQLSAQMNNFSGRVLAPDNQPIPFASVQTLNNRSTIPVDANGNFNISSKDSVLDVQVASVGLEPRNFRLQSNLTSNNLVLETPSGLQEVVVTAGRKKQYSRTTVKLQHAVPVGGWVEYEKYLEKNKRPPVNNPLMKGEVVVSFDVDRSSRLSGFKVENSLSTNYDNEAIRLIKEGPPWKLMYVRKARITVIVKF